MKATYQLGIKYAEDVVSGDVVACKQVKQACKRFLDELQRDDWRWSFSIKRANHILAFMEFGINHVKGPLANTKLKLEPWQIFILINIYGWVDEENQERRIRYALLEIARKNGKSLFASAMAIYDLLFGDEGGEIYSLATKRDQAKIAWDAAKRMVEKADPEVRDRFQLFQSSITEAERWSKYVPLGRDSKGLDGLNPSLNIFDEAAAYSDRNIVEVMTSATGARLNFLNLFITTAQFNKQTVYYENRTYMEGILSGKFEDDRWFGLIYTLDEEDDWTDKSVWIKANPNLGVSILEDYLVGEVKQAGEMQSKRNGVLVKHFNIWTSSADAWIDVAYWDSPENIITDIKREGQLFVGLDLAQVSDLCAVASMYVAGDCYHLEFKAFLPETAMQNAPPHALPIYQAAHRSGSLVITEGDITDYDQIQYYIEDLARNRDLQAVGYDPFNAAQLVTNLNKSNINMLEVRQGISYLSPAAKETERLIMKGDIKHLDDPFISWQLENCVSYVDMNENLKIRKGDDQSRKIDCIIALIMATSLAAGKLEAKKQFRFTPIKL